MMADHRGAARRLASHARLALLLACSLLLVGTTGARYLSSDANAEGARVAAGALSVTSTSNDEVALTTPADGSEVSRSFSFTVSNSEGGRVSDVAITYDVEITLEEALPEGVTLQLDGRSAAATEGGTRYVFGNAGTFEAGAAGSRAHELAFVATGGVGSGVDYQSDVTVSVIAEQVD